MKYCILCIMEVNATLPNRRDYVDIRWLIYLNFEFLAFPESDVLWSVLMFVNLSVSGNFLVVPEWRVRLCSIVVNATGLKPGDRRFDSAQGLTEIFCLSACIYPSSEPLQYFAFLWLMERLARSHGGWFTSSNWRLIVQFHSRRKQSSVCPP